MKKDNVNTQDFLPVISDRSGSSPPDEREQVPRQAHDHFAKAVLQDLQVSRTLLQSRLPPALVRQCRWETLHLESPHLHNRVLREKIVDLLFSVQMEDDQDLKLFVHVEHLSAPKPWSILYSWETIFEYLCKLRNKEKVSKLPVVVPIILYQNARPFPHTNDIYELFHNPALAREYWMQPISIFNIAQAADETLTPEDDRAAAVQLTMKYVVYPGFEGPFYDRIVPLMKRLRETDAPGVKRLLEQIIAYVYKKADFTDEEKFVKVLHQIDAELEATVLSLAQRLSDKKKYEGLLAGEQLGLQKGKQWGLEAGEQIGLQKGEQLGLQRGKQEGRKAVILTMLEKGASPALVAQFTDITVTEVEKMAAERDQP